MWENNCCGLKTKWIIITNGGACSGVLETQLEFCRTNLGWPNRQTRARPGVPCCICGRPALHDLERRAPWAPPWETGQAFSSRGLQTRTAIPPAGTLSGLAAACPFPSPAPSGRLPNSGLKIPGGGGRRGLCCQAKQVRRSPPKSWARVPGWTQRGGRPALAWVSGMLHCCTQSAGFAERKESAGLMNEWVGVCLQLLFAAKKALWKDMIRFSPFLSFFFFFLKSLRHEN